MQKFLIMRNKLFIIGILFISLFSQSFIINEKVDEDKVEPVAEVGLNVGNKAPELAFKNPDGDIIKLSSLKGQIVLIDFWASWCPPCRKENPALVEAYRLYKDSDFKNGSGFTIYSVSLDKNEKDWIKAISDDELEWEYHVSDLKYWYSEAASTYGIRSIPSNYLIDGDGIIVARNLRGPYLKQALENQKNKVFKKKDIL